MPQERRLAVGPGKASAAELELGSENLIDGEDERVLRANGEPHAATSDFMRCEPISDTANRKYKSRIEEIVFQFVTQLPYMHVDGAIDDLSAALGPSVEELLAGEHAARRIRQRVQQTEFDGGQLERLTVHRDRVLNGFST